MRIAYLGWGSLIWNPGKLGIRDSWKHDGPVLPIEFARISGNHRLTLVICPRARKVSTLWVEASTGDMREAITSLAEREDTSEKNIGFYCASDNESRSKSEKSVLLTVKAWAKKKNYDCVVWTDLQPTFEYKTLRNAISHLRSLDGRTYHIAKEYICNAPLQIQTKNRAALEKELNLASSAEKCEAPIWAKLKRNLENRTRLNPKH